MVYSNAMESVWSVSKLSTESVGSRRELCSHRRRRRDKTVSSRRRCVTADATRLDSFVSSASAVCIGLYFYQAGSLHGSVYLRTGLLKTLLMNSCKSFWKEKALGEETIDMIWGHNLSQDPEMFFNLFFLFQVICNIRNIAMVFTCSL